ncbi:ankyrin repeats (3 copies) domain-containing protein [Paramyrothecium foliicola]|nr:ankyrin repeats (3 copies) domain-containing protein [Paramyrothecium foliicola]
MLNAQMAVRASLEKHQRNGSFFRSWHHFNIIEDWRIALQSVDLETPTLTDQEVDLLITPLPVNLSTMNVNEDLLILVAAYEGNVNRYARLQRPRYSVPYELHCLVPGVYRSTAMAVWLSRNPHIMEIVAEDWSPHMVASLRGAIHARHVMNNDISRLFPDMKPFVPDEELPS